MISMGDVVIPSYERIKTKEPEQLHDDADGQFNMTPSGVELNSR